MAGPNSTCSNGGSCSPPDHQKWPRAGFKRLGVHPRQAGRSAICHQNAPVSCNNPCCFRKAVACGDMAEGAMVDHVQTVPRGMRHKYALCLGFKGSVIECAAIRTGDFYGSYGAEGHSGSRCWYRTFGTLRTGLEHCVWQSAVRARIQSHRLLVCSEPMHERPQSQSPPALMGMADKSEVPHRHRGDQQAWRRTGDQALPRTARFARLVPSWLAS
jgi:hypothetical protein